MRWYIRTVVLLQPTTFFIRQASSDYIESPIKIDYALTYNRFNGERFRGSKARRLSRKPRLVGSNPRRASVTAIIASRIRHARLHKMWLAFWVTSESLLHTSCPHGDRYACNCRLSTCCRSAIIYMYLLRNCSWLQLDISRGYRLSYVTCVPLWPQRM